MWDIITSATFAPFLFDQICTFEKSPLTISDICFSFRLIWWLFIELVKNFTIVHTYSTYLCSVLSPPLAKVILNLSIIPCVQIEIIKKRCLLPSIPNSTDLRWIVMRLMLTVQIFLMVCIFVTIEYTFACFFPFSFS